MWVGVSRPKGKGKGCLRVKGRCGRWGEGLPNANVLIPCSNEVFVEEEEKEVVVVVGGDCGGGDEVNKLVVCIT